MSNKFWAQEADSDDSDTDGDEGLEEVRTVSEPVARNRFTIESDSESDEDVRTIKTKKDKTMDSLHSSCRLLRSYMKMGAWQRLKKEFTNNCQYSTKYQAITKEVLPRYYIRLICDLETLIESSYRNKEDLQKMSKADANALKQMKTVIIRHNAQYIKKINQYKLDPDTSVPSEDENLGELSNDEDDDAESSQSEAPVAKKTVTSSKKKSSSSGSSSGSSSSSSSSSSDSDGSSGSSSSSSSRSSRSSYSSRSSSSGSSSSGSSRSSSGSSRTSSRSSYSSKSSTSVKSPTKEVVVVFDFAKLKGRIKWLKSTTEMLKRRNKVKPVIDEKKRTARHLIGPSVEEDIAIVEQQVKVKTRKAVVLDVASFTAESIVTFASQATLSSSKRRLDESISLLQSCCRISTAFNVACQIKVHCFLASSYLSGGSSCTVESIKDCCLTLNTVCRLLGENSHLRLVSAADEVGLTHIKSMMDDEDEVNRVTRDIDDVVPVAHGVAVEEMKVEGDNVAIIGNLCAYLSRLRYEMHSLLQTTNHHVREYLQVVELEPLLVSVLQSGLAYFRRIKESKSVAQVSLMIIERMYCFHESVLRKQAHLTAWQNKYGVDRQAIHVALLTSSSSSSSSSHPACIDARPIGLTATEIKNAEVSLFGGFATLSEYLTFLTRCVYVNGDEKSRSTALLSHVYHLALDNDFHQARNLLLSSHIQEAIDGMEKTTKILFNRAMAVLGLSAFRHGYYSKCSDMLGNLCGSGKARELLAQGSSKSHDRDNDQEKEDKRLIVPHHMQISLDVLDACYHVSSLMSDLPSLVKQSSKHASPFVNQHRLPPIAKFLRRYEGGWNGLAESCRDQVICGCSVLLEGDYEECVKILSDISYWDLIPSHDGKAGSDIRAMLTKDLRREACRAFVSTSASVYDDIKLTSLSNMYQLTSHEIVCLLSEMICKEEIDGRLDGQLFCYAARQRNAIDEGLVDCTERLNMLIDANERLLQSRRAYLDQNDPSNDYDKRSYRRNYQQRNDSSANYNSNKQHGGGRFARNKKHYHNKGNDQHRQRKHDEEYAEA